MCTYIIKLIVAMMIITPVYLLLRRPWKRSCPREAVLGIFVLFMTALLALAFEGSYGTPWDMAGRAAERIRSGNRINLIPFRTIGNYWRHRETAADAFLVNIAGNIVMFIPWGLGLALLWKKNQSVLRILLFAVLLPLFIETTQLFLERTVDVDDLILNFVGGCLGGLIYWGIWKIVPGIDRLAE